MTNEARGDGKREEAPPESLEGRVTSALRTVYDPEIPVNIHELGLIYELHVREGGEVAIVMTLTSPACPAAQSLPSEVRRKVEGVEGVTKAEVEVTWDPPWGPERMTPEARLQLGMF